MTRTPDRQQPLRPDNASSRQRIFERIRAAHANGNAGSPGAGVAASPARDTHAGAASSLQSALRSRMADARRGPQPLPPDSLVESFVQKALSLSCTVDRVSGADQIGQVIGAYLSAQHLSPQLVAWPVLAQSDWLSGLTGAGLSIRLGAPVGNDLVGLSAVACAVAETGTLVLRSSPDTPASTHLLPETHIAVLSTRDIVHTLEDAFERIKSGGQPLPRALNLVSGPSRTGDIEQTIVLGAHGPYRVHLVIVEAE